MLQLKIAILATSLSVALHGQTTTARITGIVKDSSGATAGGVRVEARNMATGVLRTVNSNAEGLYLFTNLLIGEYAVSATLTGFKRFEQKPVALEVDTTVRVDIMLQPGDVQESVTVEGSAPLVATDSSGTYKAVDNATIIQAPIIGRNYMALATLAAGATPGGPGNDVNRTRSEGVALSVNGQRVEHNNYMLDGVDNNATLFGNAVIVPSLDAVQEFKVQTSSYAAEYGRASGAVVNVALKSGTNQVRGTLFHFLQNDKLSANGFFPNFFRNPRLPLRQNSFGASVGGPLIRNKLFWFGNYEGFRRRDVNFAAAIVPTAAQRGGDFSGRPVIGDPFNTDASGNRTPFPGNRIPTQRFHPAASKLFAFYPQPNTTGDPTRNYQQTVSSPQDRDQVHGRGDWNITDRDQLMVRYSWTDRADLAAALTFNGQTTTNRHQGAVAGWTRSLTPSMLNEVRFGITRYRFGLIPEGLGTDFPSQLGLPSFAQSAGLQRFPTHQITNYLGFGGNDAIPLERDENSTQLIEQFTWIRAKHALKFGGDLRMYGNRNFQPQTSAGFYSFTGTFTGDSIADVLLGVPQTQRILNPTGFDAGRLRNQRLSLYAQDDWSIHPRLTINAGLRWERDGAWTEVNNRWATFDYATGQVVYPKDAPLAVAIPFPTRRLDHNTLRNPINNNFAPRFGVAWRPFGGNRTVVRGAYGVFWAQAIANVQLQLVLNPPFLLRTETISNARVPQFTWGTFPGISADSLVPRTPVITGTLDPAGYLNGYSQQWNFGIEHELVRNLAVKASYVGSKGTHLERRQEGNPALPPAAGAVQARRRSPLIGSIVQQTSNAFSTYNSMQLAAERRLSGGLQFGVAYTWSRSLDDTSTWLGLGGQESAFAQDPSRLFLEKGLSGFNIRHRLASSFFYELPFRFSNRIAQAVAGGWQTSGIVTIQSGFPFSITTPGDIANAGTRIVRADVLRDWRLDGAARGIDSWFAADAFANPASFRFGTSARNQVEGPGSRDINLTLMKAFRLGERRSIKLRGEFYNLPNLVNLSLPGALVGSPNFARIRGNGAPRNIQLALKLYF
ncbi:MAG: TonB-dependent receptor [Bryobacterales bacterium]|nr:TonB-dependent receptor [Bryobacterales bacterium]